MLKILAKIAGVVMVCVGILSLALAILGGLGPLLFSPELHPHVAGFLLVFTAILNIAGPSLILGGTFLLGWARRKIVFGVVLVAIVGLFFHLLVVIKWVIQGFL
ncbi:MAG: hypothetical protein QME58_04790 [Bacteroidota bacterium]|nr:hypothetical protein [Bacteroidota bacterium]